MRIKLVFLLLTVGIYQSQAQDWSSHLITTSFPVIVQTGQTPPIPFNDLRVLPDAITINEGNQNSVLDPNSVITAFSPSFLIYGDDPNWDWNNPNDVGTWLIAKSPTGQTVLSKKITVANHFLRIWSLQYDFDQGRELVIFTGALVRIGGDGVNRMVVGSYNLLNNTVNMEVMNQPYQSSYAASQGIGVRSIPHFSSEHYIAIGQTADKTDHDPHPSVTTNPSNLHFAYYPIGIIFTVDNAGLISIKHKEIKNFKFKPHTMTDAVTPIQGTGNSIIVGGMKISKTCLDPVNAPPASCDNYIAAAAYTFDVSDVGGWSIAVDEGVDIKLNGIYAHTAVALMGPDVHVIVDDNYPSSRQVILGLTDRHDNWGVGVSPAIEGTGDLLLFRYKIDMGNGRYTHTQRIMYDLKGGSPSGANDPVYGKLERLLPNEGHTDFTMIFSLIDPLPSTFWTRDNTTSIGYAQLSKTNLQQPYLYFSSIYADDDPVNWYNQTEIYHCTGINTELVNGEGPTYLVADGYRQTTQLSRGHFNFDADGVFDKFPCVDVGFGEEVFFHFHSQGNRNTQSSLYPTPSHSTVSTSTDYVIEYPWTCEEAPSSDFSEKKGTTALPEIQSNHELIQVSENVYRIQGLSDPLEHATLCNASGQMVPFDMDNDYVNLNNLAPGIYIFNYEVLGETHFHKLIVQ